MTVKIHIVKNNPVFQYRYKCPIDKRWTYFTKNDKLCFGAGMKFMGHRTNTVPAKANFQNMTVSGISIN